MPICKNDENLDDTSIQVVHQFDPTYCQFKSEVWNYESCSSETYTSCRTVGRVMLASELDSDDS